jgi:ribosomal protein L24E
MPKCTFCGESIAKGTGKMYILNDGKILWFDRSKCQKNYFHLGRKPLETKWTQEYRREHKKGIKSDNKENKENKGESQ